MEHKISKKNLRNKKSNKFIPNSQKDNKYEDLYPSINERKMLNPESEKFDKAKISINLDPENPTRKFDKKNDNVKKSNKKKKQKEKKIKENLPFKISKKGQEKKEKKLPISKNIIKRLNLDLYNIGKAVAIEMSNYPSSDSNYQKDDDIIIGKDKTLMVNEFIYLLD